MASLRKNAASQHIGFCLNAKADGTPVTAGGAGNVVIDNGVQASCGGTFTHKGSGQWDYAPTQAETNGTCISFAFTGTGAIQVGMLFYTDNWDTSQPVVTSGTGTDQLSLTSGRIDIGKALGTAVTLDSNNVLNVSAKYLAGTALTGRDIGASVLLSTGTGTGQLDFTSGVVKANATQWLGGTIPAVNTTGVPLVDTKYVTGTLQTAKDIGGAVPAAAPGASGGLLISGSNAGTTTLAALTVTGALTVSDGIAVSRSTLNGSAVVLTGNGSGDGLKAVGGTTGNGIEAVGGSAASAGDGLKASVLGTGVPIRGDITGNVHGTLDTLTTYTGNTPQTGDVFAQLPARFSSLSIDASGRIDLGSIKGTASAGTAGYVGLDWGALLNKTAVVALTSTTVANLTNAPTSGDFTAAMKSSLNAATPASVTGSVGSVSAGVTVTTNNDKTGYSLTQNFPVNFASLAIDLSGRIDLGKVLGAASAGAAGYVGIDWSKVTNPATVLALSNTTISPNQVVASVTSGVTITGSVDVGSVNGHSASGVTTLGAVWGTSVAPAFTGSAMQADVRDWSGAAVAAPNAAGVPLVDVGYLRGTLSAGVPGYAALDWSHVNAPTTAVALTGTTLAPVTVGGYGAGEDPGTLVLNTALVQSYSALHAAPTLAQAINLLTALQTEKSTSGATQTVYKDDGVTVAATFILNDATLPTAITRGT